MKVLIAVDDSNHAENTFDCKYSSLISAVNHQLAITIHPSVTAMLWTIVCCSVD